MNPKANLDPEQIKRLRNEGKSTRTIAAELGVSVATIYKYEDRKAARKTKRAKKSRPFSDGTALPPAGGFRFSETLRGAETITAECSITITLSLRQSQIEKLLGLLL